MSSWQAHPHCPSDARAKLEKAVQALPEAYLAPLCKNEEFETPEACLRRLQGYALSQGFAVVQKSGSMKQKRPRFQYKCIHHGKETQNNRQLELHVERDTEGNLITRRKRDGTYTQQKDCPWEVYLSLRKAERGSSRTALLLGITSAEHSHSMAPNPLRYRQHLKALEEYSEAAKIASIHKKSFLSYTTSQRILEKSGLSLPCSDYYNLYCEKTVDGIYDEFEALVYALNEVGFKFACRMELTSNRDGEVIKRQLQQVWFALDEQIQLAQRFIADFTMLSDGTFSTNDLNLTLNTMIGVTNTGHSFPAVQSFARSEAALNFDFIFQCNQDFIFTGKIPPPRVIISDQAPGMISSLPNYLPTAILQFCDWHIQQNIKSRLLKGRYTKDEREQIIAQFWRYCKAQTLTEIIKQRLELTALLTQTDEDYVLRTWQPKEPQFLHFYTREYPNLGCFSNQRAESTHPIIKSILNPQLHLAEATNRLNQTIRQKLRFLASEEINSGGKLPRTLDRRAFSQLIDTITIYAIEKIAKEWEDTKEKVDDNSLETTELCSCEILLRFSLPCRHYLQEIYRNGQPIPRSLCHPRWWIHGPTVQFTDWKPSINTVTLPISPPRNKITQSVQKIIEYRDTLQGEAKARVDQSILQSNERVLLLAYEAEQESRLPTELPEKVKKPGWRRHFKAHDKTTRRLMTLTEALEQDERQQGQSSNTSENFHPAAPDPLSLPPSTTPATLESRKRARRHTTVYREAFGDSQEDPTAGIKRGKAGGLL